MRGTNMKKGEIALKNVMKWREFKENNYPIREKTVDKANKWWDNLGSNFKIYIYYDNKK